jgi:hypothetical protein
VKPGVYEGLSAEAYHAIEAVSNSRLTQLLRSPAHLRAYIEEPRESTEAQLIGSAADVLTLEPELFDERYAVAGICAAIKKGDGLRCTNTGTKYLDGEWFCGTKGHAPDGAMRSEKIAISPEDKVRCERVAEAVRSHPKIGKILASPGRAQLTIVWRDPGTGLLCKGRIDYLSDAFGAALDMKTTKDARPHSFEKSIAEYGYHRQLPFYEDGLRENGIDLKHLVFAAVEKEPPFAVAGYRLSDGAADEGRIELRALLHRYAELQDTPMAEWPAYGEAIEDISIPAWAFGRVKEGAFA